MIFLRSFKKQCRFPVYVFTGLLVLLLLGACVSGRVIDVEQPRITPQTGTNQFLAGAAEINITPPPGLPLFGFSVEAAGFARGYWTRLKARAIVFQNETGERMALVQLDMGAVSGLLHRETAKRLAPWGFGPGNLLLAASHTHAAPGGFFGEKFYNRFGSGRFGFFRHLVDWLADRISDGVKAACADLAPARIGAGVVTVRGLSRNRSLEAWILNYAKDPTRIPYPGVIPDVYLLRVDHVRDSSDNGTVPIALFAVAPVHATAIGNKNKLYHGDLFGVASRYLSSGITRKYGLKRSIVAAVAAGPQGDVSPAWTEQGIPEARRLGRLLAENVERAFSGLDGNLEKAAPRYMYIEPRIQGARLKQGKLCDMPVAGVAVLAGAEDGRSFLYNKLGVYEGRKREHPVGCQGVKLPAGGFLQRLLVKPGNFPGFAPLQIIRFGDLITFAAVPGEPTTEVGYRVKTALKEKVNTRYMSLIAAANEYMSYIATPEEYSAQHFEGAFTLYGPNESLFFRERLETMAEDFHDNQSEFSPVRQFNPGKSQTLFIRGKSAKPGEWRALKTEVQRDPGGKLVRVRFHWIGLKRYRYLKELPMVSVESGGSNVLGPSGVEETDSWLNFIVERTGPRYWTAAWMPPEGFELTGSARIKVSRPGFQPLFSDEFSL